MKKTIMAICVMGLPLAGFADVVVTALAQDGGTAILYNPADGAVYDTSLFSGGTATLSTSMLSFFDKYAVTTTYTPGQTWRSDIYWNAGSGNVAGYKTYIGEDDAVTALSGSITSRSFVSTSGSRSISMTLAANGNLGAYNNESNELDANLLVYRPSASVADIAAASSVTKIWDSLALLGPYDSSATDWGYGYDEITLTKNGDFYATYLGKDLGAGSYELSFAAAVDPGDSSYNTGSVVSNPDGSVTFTSDAFSSVDALADQTPYYAMLESAWMYDSDGNYSQIPDDAGLILTSPDYYAIPEPAVIVLLMGSGGMLIGVNRVFRKKQQA